MIFNLNFTHDKIKAKERLEKHIKEGSNLEMRKVPLKRSTDANALYWLWLTCLQDETGENKDQFHKFFKAKYIGTTEEEIFGLLVTSEPTTTDKSRKYFWEFMQQVKSEAASDFGVRLPLPKDQGFQEFYEKYSEYS